MPHYSTWIRQSKIFLFWVLFASTVALGVLLGALFSPLYGIVLLSFPFLYIAVVISLTAHQFDDRGGGFQNRIHDLLVDSLRPQGTVLDIGCGSGKLIIKIAKRHPGSHVGLDFWGDDWEYSKSQCEKNAELEATNGLRFLQGSAAALPFESASLENVVSCLTFHEVADARDKTDVVTEALRVLAPHGRFCFFDLFDDPAFYPSRDDVLAAITKAGGRVEVNEKLRDTVPLPFPLNDPKVLKYAVLIAGTKIEAGT